MNRKNIELDQLATSIDNYRDNTKMYQAVKTLKRKPIQNATVHDNKGRTIMEPQKFTKQYKNISRQILMRTKQETLNHLTSHQNL